MKTTKYKIILSGSLLCYSSLSFAFNITYVNKCNYPVWIKDLAKGQISSNNIMLNPQSASVKDYSKDYGSSLGNYMMWFAAGCDSNGSNCMIGNINNNETLFEITVPGIYDVSAVNGYTFPVSVNVDKPQGKCQNIDGSKLNLDKCPVSEDLGSIGPSVAPYAASNNVAGFLSTISYGPETYYNGSKLIDMVHLHHISVPPLNPRITDSSQHIIGCKSPRTLAFAQTNQDVIDWYACAGILGPQDQVCGDGPNYTTNYFKEIKVDTTNVYTFPYDDALDGVGSNQCSDPTTNYTVVIGNPDNPDACPNTGSSVTPPPPPPATCQAPELATFTTTKNIPNGSSITINWDTPSSSTVTGYRVFNFNDQPIGGDGNHIIYTSSYTDNTTPILAVGQQSVPYVYKVQSVCVNGDSQAITVYSTPKLIGEADVICPAPDVATFTIKKNKADGSSITIDWPDVGSNVTGYNVFNWNGALIGTTGTSSYTDNTTPVLAVGQQSIPYKYQIQSICGKDTSKLSAVYPAIVTGEADKCEAPDISTFGVVTNRLDASLITINWTTPGGKSVTGYQVFNWLMKPVGNTTVASYQDTPPHLAKNQSASYWYYVQSKCSDGSLSDVSTKYIATVTGG